MPRPRHHPGTRQAAEALVRTAPLVSRWIERLLAAHEPPLTVAQYLVLEAVAEGEIVGAELARRAAVSPAAVSQLLAALEGGGLLSRARLGGRRQPLALTEQGSWTLRSAQTNLRERLAGLLADLPPHEADALAHLLDLLRSSLAGTPPPPRPHRPPPPPGHGPKHRKHP
jgi:DNA-binding MarR family transcriptional regulator